MAGVGQRVTDLGQKQSLGRPGSSRLADFLFGFHGVKFLAQILLKMGAAVPLPFAAAL